MELSQDSVTTNAGSAGWVVYIYLARLFSIDILPNELFCNTITIPVNNGKEVVSAPSQLASCQGDLGLRLQPHS